MTYDPAKRIQPTPASSISRPSLLRGFEHIPLFSSDLTPFGAAVSFSPRGISASHRDGEGRETGCELIHAGERGFSFTPGGTRSLFRTPGPCRPRLVLVDGPVQAICLAALKPHAHRNTTFAASSGSWSRGADKALTALVTAHPPREVILAFAPLAAGSCPSRDRCVALLRELMPPGSREPVVLEPPPGGWVGALRAARSPGQAAA
ncbi:hypothetical protein [Roseomonas harenae]|uniref:hypothetical protein n=1 Tax=Muricoccus harenae TaxID=2692566 RepID=UPI001331BF8A|nr:hypothetical protein [Roseomonas harenae]